MKRTPSFIMGLGAARARAAGDVERLQALVERVTQELASAQADLVALDRVIRRADSTIDPTEVRAVRPLKVPNKDKGKRETIEEALLVILSENGTAARSTVELAYSVAARLKLDFIDPHDFGKWLHNSVSRKLKKMTKSGAVVRLHEANQTTRLGWWQIARGSPVTLEQMRQQVQAAGVSVNVVEVPLPDPSALTAADDD
jgi:hypothetical protein